MEYVLIIFMHAGMPMNNVSGFQTKEFCEEAGNKAVKEFKNSYFNYGKYVCVRVK